MNVTVRAFEVKADRYGWMFVVEHGNQVKIGRKLWLTEDAAIEMAWNWVSNNIEAA